MDSHAESAAHLALAKQAFEQLLTLCAPENVVNWKPSDVQRAAYIRLADCALEGLERLEYLESRRLLSEGSDALVSLLPEPLLRFVRQEIRPSSLSDLRRQAGRNRNSS